MNVRMRLSYSFRRMPRCEAAPIELQISDCRLQIYVGSIEFPDRSAAKEGHRADQLGAQDLDRARDTRAAGGAQPVGVRAADEHGAGANRERLCDVAPAAD